MFEKNDNFVSLLGANSRYTLHLLRRTTAQKDNATIGARV